MAANTIEREIKLDVGLDFSLPDLSGVVDGAGAGAGGSTVA
jgi:hypothetical protein